MESLEIVLFLIGITLQTFVYGNFDPSLTILSKWGRLTGPSDSTIMMCLSANNPPEALTFDRVLNTGQDPHLPNNKVLSIQRDPQSAKILTIPGSNEDKDRRFGAFSCQVTVGNYTTEVITLKQASEDKVEVSPYQPIFKTVVGGNVTLRMTKRMNNPGVRLLWRHRGNKQSMAVDKLLFPIISAKPENAGIYELFFEQRRKYGVHGLTRLIVRGCPAEKYGYQCEYKCQTCYNGGICHEITGVCICPPGFYGDQCDKACGPNRFGPSCEWQCDPAGPAGAGCARYQVCLSDPYGCSCASGYTGADCTEICPAGKYGADCSQSCQCRGGSLGCDAITGACSDGCGEGWTGNTCQEPVLGPVQELKYRRLKLANQLRVGWREPRVTHGEISYVVLSRLVQQKACGKKLENTDMAELATKTREVILAQLLPFSVYEVIVYANTSTLKGEQSSIYAVTEQGAPRGRPRSAVLEFVDAYELTFTWDPLTCYESNGQVKEYDTQLWPLPEGVLIPDNPNEPWPLLQDFGKDTISASQVRVISIDSAKDTSVTFTQLHPYRHYAFRVRAKTSVGAGPWSEWVIAMTEYQVPPAPQLLLIESSARSLTLGVATPVLPPGVVHQVYLRGWADTLEYINLNLTHQMEEAPLLNVTFNVSSDFIIHNYTFYKLQPFTPYIIQAKVSTRKGWGNWSEVLSTWTEETYPPAPSVAVFVLGSDSMLLQIGRPMPSFGIILQYRVRVAGPRPPGSQPTILVVPAPENQVDFNFTVRDLIPVSRYQIQVQAATSRGWGNWSDPIEVWTEEGVPGPPNSISLVHQNATSLHIRWSPPSVTNGKVTKFEVSCFPQFTLDPRINIYDLDNTTVIVDGATRSIIFAGLNQLTKYTVKVRARTKKGFGLPFFREFMTDLEMPPPLECYPNSATGSAIPVRILPVPIPNSCPSYYQIIVEDTENLEQIDESLLMDFNSATEEQIPYYIAASRDSSEVPEDGLVMYVGDSQIYGEYYNAPLHSDKTYYFMLRMVILDGNRNHTSISIKTSEPVKVLAIQAVEEAQPSCLFYDPQCFWFPFVVVGCSVLVIWIITSIVIYKYMNKKTPPKKIPPEKDRTGSSSSIAWSVAYRKGHSGSHSESSTLVKDHSSV